MRAHKQRSRFPINDQLTNVLFTSIPKYSALYRQTQTTIISKFDGIQAIDKRVVA